MTKCDPLILSGKGNNLDHFQAMYHTHSENLPRLAIRTFTYVPLYTFVQSYSLKSDLIRR